MDLYYMPLSPPCRSVLLTAKALNISLNCRLTDVFAGETRTESFLKMNPAHTIPTLDDNGFYLIESRPILTYLVQKYGKDSTLYPADPKERAVVNSRLLFDMGTLYLRFCNCVVPLLLGTSTVIEEEKISKLREALDWLDGFLYRTTWAAGDNMTVADHSLVATVSTIEATGVELSPWVNICKWYSRCMGSMKGYSELNHGGAQQYGTLIKNKMEEHGISWS